MAVWTSPQLIETYLNRRIDSEFFDPAYIEAENATLRCDTESLGRLGYFVPGPFGSAFHVQNYDFKSPYRYIRGRDVKPFFLLDDDNRYVPESDFNRLVKYSVLPQDLMISVVGTLGNVAICTEDDTPAVFSCKSTVFRSRDADPYFLLAYLNSHFGRMCLLRRQRGAVQTGLNIEDLGAVPVPRFGSLIEEDIASLVESSHNSAKQANQAYTQAQQLLESELGLAKLRFEKPVGYTARFSDTFSDGRIDADYFQPQFKQIQKHIKAYLHGFQTLLSICTALKPNFDPSKTPADTFEYIELSNINGSLGMVNGASQANGRSLPSRARRKVSTGDIIASSVVGSIDKSALIHEEQDGFIASTGFFHLRPRNVSPEYLLMLTKSKPVQMQLQQQSTGGILSAVSDSRLRHVVVPVMPQATQDQITQLVKLAHEKRAESKHLLDQAKYRVEQLIEKAVQS